MNPYTIAVDFDGTVVEHEFPNVGADVPGAVETLKKFISRGGKVILWTMRDGKKLDEAIEWFEERNIPLYGVQRNPTQDDWTTSPKAYANRYIDDNAMGCPLVHMGCRRPYVDWEKIREMLGLES